MDWYNWWTFAITLLKESTMISNKFNFLRHARFLQDFAKIRSEFLFSFFSFLFFFLVAVTNNYLIKNFIYFTFYNLDYYYLLRSLCFHIANETWTISELTGSSYVTFYVCIQKLISLLLSLLVVVLYIKLFILIFHYIDWPKIEKTRYRFIFVLTFQITIITVNVIESFKRSTLNEMNLAWNFKCLIQNEK